jgi:hypothetical protein
MSFVKGWNPQSKRGERFIVKLNIDDDISAYVNSHVALYVVTYISKSLARYIFDCVYSLRKLKAAYISIPHRGMRLYQLLGSLPTDDLYYTVIDLFKYFREKEQRDNIKKLVITPTSVHWRGYLFTEGLAYTTNSINLFDIAPLLSSPPKSPGPRGFGIPQHRPAPEPKKVTPSL